jgi:hypothetical protein
MWALATLDERVINKVPETMRDTLDATGVETCVGVEFLGQDLLVALLERKFDDDGDLASIFGVTDFRVSGVQHSIIDVAFGPEDDVD